MVDEDGKACESDQVGTRSRTQCGMRFPFDFFYPIRVSSQLLCWDRREAEWYCFVEVDIFDAELKVDSSSTLGTFKHLTLELWSCSPICASLSSCSFPFNFLHWRCSNYISMMKCPVPLMRNPRFSPVVWVSKRSFPPAHRFSFATSKTTGIVNLHSSMITGHGWAGGCIEFISHLSGALTSVLQFTTGDADLAFCAVVVNGMGCRYSPHLVPSYEGWSFSCFMAAETEFTHIYHLARHGLRPSRPFDLK